jgi:ABC-type multidrug transport system permease subunit
MAAWALAKKELRLLLRDRLSALLLVGMPLLFILILGLLLGEGFGQKPDDRLRVSLVDLDAGLKPGPRGELPFPGKPWSLVIQDDLRETAGIRVEIIRDEAEARRLCHESKRAAILIFREDFSASVARCSFLKEGINPFYRDGVRLEAVGADLVRDPTQAAAASIIEQVAQVTLIRVILPYMIGRAFEKLGEPSFMSLLAQKVPGGALLPRSVKEQLGSGVQGALRDLFPNYELTGKTWAALTRSGPRASGGAEVTIYADEGGSGLLKRGAARYQVLVPAYTVMFAFALVLTVGWLFVSERQQGTLKRLRAAPITRGSVVLGKLLPCFLLSMGQGLFLLAAGKAVFGMRWGPDSWSLAEQAGWLVPVVAATSLAAMGLALFVAAVARTEMQVALIGTLIVLVLALISGCLIPRELMPERTQQLAFLTPHGWALAAYRQLLLSPAPNLELVAQACGVLAAFGLGFLTLAWWLLRLD